MYILNRILFKLYGCIDWLPNYYVSRFIISVHPSRWWKKRRLRAKNHFFGGFFVGTNIWILNVRYSIYCDFWFAFFVEKTVLKSGDGKTEENAICVIYPADVLVQLERFSYVDRNKFEQKIKQLSDGSILTMYKMGDEVYYVKLVGGYF